MNLFFYTFLAYGTQEEESVVEALDFGSLFISLGIVLGAIMSGLAAGYRWPYENFRKWANRSASISGLLLILFSVVLSANSESSNIWSMPWSFFVGVAGPCLLGISMANIIARSFQLKPPETVAIAIECCYQNTGIATSVAITMFEGEERAQAVAVPLFYGVVEAVAIGIYCVWAWKAGWTKAPADEKICTVIANTYELPYDENDDDDVDETADALPSEEGIETKAEDHPRTEEEQPKGFLESWRIFLFGERTTLSSVSADDGSIKEEEESRRQRLNTADTSVLSTPSPRKSTLDSTSTPLPIPEEAIE